MSTIALAHGKKKDGRDAILLAFPYFFQLIDGPTNSGFVADTGIRLFQSG